MIKVLIWDYCGRNGIEIGEGQAVDNDNEFKRK